MIARWLRRNKGRAEASYAKLHGGSGPGQTYCRLQSMVGRCKLWCKLHVNTVQSMVDWAGRDDRHIIRCKLWRPPITCALGNAAMVFIVITFILIFLTSIWPYSWISIRRLCQITCCWQCPGAWSKLRCSVIANHTSPTYVACSIGSSAMISRSRCMAYI